MPSLRSNWAEEPMSLTPGLDSGEWDDAGQMSIPGGHVLAKNDARFLYLAFDVVKDFSADPGTDDYFWLSFDVDRNRAITPRRDLNYALWPDQPNRLGRQQYLGAGRWTGLIDDSSDSRVRIGFGSSPNSGSSHRFWKLRIDLEELGVELDEADAPPVLPFGLRLSSTNPRFTVDTPRNFYRDFENLHRILLARQPDEAIPSDKAGDVIGGVGLIPATEIQDGYATTDPSYFVTVRDAAFGGRMNLIGNRVTLNDLWDDGARRYVVEHEGPGSGGFSPLRQSWSNYRWDGDEYVLEHFGPDTNDQYPLPDPGEDYSIDDLLLQWQSVGFSSGLHRFRIRFVSDSGSEVTSPSQTLELMVDNNLPEAELDRITHGNDEIAPCEIVEIGPGDDGLRFTITARDSEGHLLRYDLSAHYGRGQSRRITSDSYSNHVSPSRQWEGVQDHVVPRSGGSPTNWRPPVTCAYQFRLSARARVTNGYGYLSARTTDTVHLTLKVSGLPWDRFRRIRPLGFNRLDRPPEPGDNRIPD